MSKYIGTTSGLIGPVQLREPNPILYENGSIRTDYTQRLEVYNDHLKSLPVIPCVDWEPKPGQEYTEKDFRWQHQMTTHKKEVWHNCTLEAYNNTVEGSRRIVAVPVPAQPEKNLPPAEWVKQAKNALNLAQAEITSCYKRIGINSSNVLDLVNRVYDTAPDGWKPLPAANDGADELIERHRSIGDVVTKRIAMTNDKILWEAYSRWLDVLNELIEGDRETLLKAFGIQSQSPTYAAEFVEDTAIRFLDSIRDYERESGNAICYDERSSKELYTEWNKTKQ